MQKNVEAEIFPDIASSTDTFPTRQVSTNQAHPSLCWIIAELGGKAVRATVSYQHTPLLLLKKLATTNPFVATALVSLLL